MWMLMGIMGMLMASSVTDAMMRFENGQNGTAEGDDEDAPVLAIGPGADALAGGDDQPPPDRWLDEWAEDEFVSSDDMPDDTPPPDTDTDTPPPPAPTEPEARWPDPWLDGWTDDSYVSSDTTPDDDTGDEDPSDEDTDDDDTAETDDPRWPDPWLDGWTDDSYVSSDIPDDLLALAGGAGAVHVLGAGDALAAGGDGGAFVIGDWIGDGQPPSVTGFDPGTDRLIFAFDEAIGAPEITIQTDPENDLSTVLVDMVPVLLLNGTTGVSADAVHLHPMRFES